MATPAQRGSFGDLLDPRFQRIFQESKERIPDMLPRLYDFPAHNGREDMRWSSLGSFQPFTQFSGSVTYQDLAQGYDVTQTHLEFADGFQVERSLFEFDVYNKMDAQPKGLAKAAMVTRQEHGAEVFTGAFSASSDFYSNSEGVALCSNSHTTTTSGISTATGFDNLVTTAFSRTAMVAARIQMRGFKDDAGNPMPVMADEIWYPVDIFDVVQESLLSEKQPDNANNAENVNRTGLSSITDGTGRNGWEFMTDANDWFLCDSQERKDHLHWVDAIPLEFAFVEDFDTLVAKWRAYMAYSWAWDNWRWIIGAQVS